MKRVVLMRHAKSSWDNANLSDHDRPLNQRGQRDAPRMAAWLEKQPFRPDWCLCSTARRAVETATLLRDSFETTLPWEQLGDLYHAMPEEIVSALQQLPEEIETPLIVAHNPGLETLVAIWSRESRPFPTAAISAFEIDEPIVWSELQLTTSMRELSFQRPKALQTDR
ncbi:MAG: hypothetical protein CMJ47_01755 [Planctomyces sp.]|nr:hypothetical protein [Planctomyces sp.]